MENSAYVSPPPLPPQAHLSSAAAAFQAACNNTQAGLNFQEALLSRMSRGPFGLSGTDIKDHFAGLGLAAAAASGRAGGLEGFPAGLPLLPHMQPPFGLHPFDPRLPFSGGAFRPLFGNTAAAAAAAAAAAVAVSSANDSNASLLHKSFTSAFQPPTSSHNSMSKSGKGSPPTLFSPGQNLYPRSSAGSPGSPSSSPPASLQLHHHRGGGGGGGMKTDENSNTDRHVDSVSPASVDSNGGHHDDEKASKKIRLCSSKEYGCCCPICGLPLRTSELEVHYTQELEYLAKLSAAIIVSHEHKNQNLKSPHDSSMIKSHQHSPGLGSIEIAPRSRWDTFQRIQRNRQSRIRVKLSRRAGKRPDEILEEDEPLNHRSPRQQQQQQHGGPQSSSTPAPHSLHHLLSVSNGAGGGNMDDEDIDIVGDDHANNNNNGRNGANLSMSSSDGSRELQLHVYGPPQFSEADVLNCMKQLEDEAAAAETAEHESDHHSFIKTEAQSPRGGDSEEDGCDGNKQLKEEDHGRRHLEDDEHGEDVATLKARLRKLEGSAKCSKCLKTLKQPVVNVGCWHVQCEKCWLSSLGTKKCCSLCGINTVPSDLRKVYL